MKKLFFLLLINIFFNCSNAVYAQSLSIEETKKMLCSYKWFLRRLEEDGKMFSVPKEIQGLKMVFKSNGTVYSYLPDTKESDATIWTWDITKTNLTIYKSSGKEVNKYRLVDFIGYTLYLTDNDEDDMPTFVFEQAEKIAETKPDKAGISYIPEVKIGNQVWMQRNLDVDRFRNGDWIPEARTAEEWKEAHRNKTPAWCYMDYDELTNKKFGKMYNWYCIEDRRGLAPEGWHIPSLAEARVLINEMGGDKTASHALRSKTGWKDNANSTNLSGFSANGAGKCWIDGTFMEKNFSAYFATSTKNTPDREGKYQVNYFLLQQTSGIVFNNHSTFPGCGLSVRCLKN